MHVGVVSDKFDRRKIIAITQASLLVVSFLLGFTTATHWIFPAFTLVMVFLYGTAFAYEGPALFALLPTLVSKKRFPRVVALISSVQTTVIILGPAVAGFIYIYGPQAVYWSITAFNAVAIGMALTIRSKHLDKTTTSRAHAVANKQQNSPLEGFRYIWSNKGILGAVSLDMFSVLLGGVTALLPIFATDILHVGPTGFGFLRAAPSVGGLIMSVILVANPIRHKTGLKMFGAVAVFGVATICFALSHNIFISIAALIILGAADEISVVIRSTYIQLMTPDEVRGRVSAVNLIFIGASNQLGEFESGTVAYLLGPIPAAIIGGVGTLIVVSICAWRFPELRKLDQIK
jgi:MFS family permease